MVERNLRIKRSVPCEGCGEPLELTAYVDGRLDGRCERCNRTTMLALRGSLARFLTPARGT
jgi:hypothetical protein